MPSTVATRTPIHRPVVAYAASLGALAVAVLVRRALDPILGGAMPFMTLVGAVAAAVWLGGYAPALLVCGLGWLVCNQLFAHPHGGMQLDGAGAVVGFVAYVLTCGVVIAFGEVMRAAQARAAEQKELLRITLHSIGDAVITTDVAGNVTYLNEVAESVTGWTHDEAWGHPLGEVFRIVEEDTRRPVESPATRALREGVVVGLANHTLLVRRDGSERPIDDSAAPIRDERGRVSGCVLVFRDVSAQREAEARRRRDAMAARFLAAIVESSNDAIVGKSLEGVIQSWNAAAERLFGYTAAEAIGRHISLVIPPERLAEEDHILSNIRAGRRIEHFETERMRADGGRILVSLTISPIKDEAGNVVGASKIVRDVTLQRRAEEVERRLAADREKFVTLIESSTDFIGICDLNGVPLFVNRAGLALVGLDSVEQAKRTPVRDFFFPEDQARIVDEFLPGVLARGHGEIEIRFRHFGTGAARWMVYKVLTLKDAAGQLLGFGTVSQDVTDRKRMEDDLRALAAELSEADRRKDEFLAMLAHELRNPLAPISNAVQVLRLGVDDGEAVRSTSAVLQRQVGHLSRLVDDLLDVNRISRGKIELRKERVELAPIVAHAVDATRALYKSLDHEVSVTLAPEPVYVDGDPTRLTQVVGNLLNNACKFTDRGGRIAVTLERDGDHAVVRVRDDGIGLDAAHIPVVFEMFRQVDTSLERSRGGLGIGLTLVKTLVEMHGGTVDVRSDGRGRGAEFVVRLPVAARAPKARAPVPPPAVASVPCRVLIVDDNADGADSLAMLLQLDGHEIRIAHDGLEAIEAAAQFRPDVVLLDIGLPKMNGYEVCRRIRREPWGKDVVLVALTGWGQEEDRHRSRRAGFDIHVTKPVDHEKVLELLGAVAKRDGGARATPHRDAGRSDAPARGA